MQVQLALDHDRACATALGQSVEPIERARAAPGHTPEDLAIADRPVLVVEDSMVLVEVSEHDCRAAASVGCEHSVHLCVRQLAALFQPTCGAWHCASRH